MELNSSEFSLSSFFEELFFRLDLLQVTYEKTPSHIINFTSCLEEIKAFLKTNVDQCFYLQDLCRAAEHKQLLPKIEEDEINKYKAEKDEIMEGLKRERRSKKTIIAYFKRKLQKIIQLMDSESEAKKDIIMKKLRNLESLVPWEGEMKENCSETSTPFSRYSGIPSFISNSQEELLNQANISEENNQNINDSKCFLDNIAQNFPNDVVLFQKCQEIGKKMEKYGELDLKSQENLLKDMYSCQEAMQSKKRPDGAFKNHVKIEDFLPESSHQKNSKRNAKEIRISESLDFNQVMDESCRKFADNGEMRIDKSSILKKEINFGSGSILSQIENIERKKASNQNSLLSLLENNQPPAENKVISGNHPKKKGNKLEMMCSASSKKKENQSILEETNLKDFSPAPLVKENNVNKLRRSEILRLTRKKEQKNEEKPLVEWAPNLNKIKLVLNKVNFSKKKIN